MDQATAIKRRAQLLIQRGALKDAMAEYEKLLGIESVNPYAYILIGDLAARMGSRSDALHRYHQGVEAYESLGLHRNAIAILKRLMRLEPGQVKNLRRLADVYAKEGLLAEAIAHYLQFATGRIKDNATTEAREALDIILRFGVPNAEIAGRVTELLCAIGDHEKAARELLKLAADLEGRGQGERARLLRIRAENIVAEAGLPGLPELSAAEPDNQGLIGREIDPNASRVETISSHGIPAAEGIGVLPGLERDGDMFSPVAAAPPALAQMLSLADESTIAGESETLESADEPPMIEMPEYEEPPAYASPTHPPAQAEPEPEESPHGFQPPEDGDNASGSKMPLGLFGGEDAVVTAIGQAAPDDSEGEDASMIGKAPGSRAEGISEQVANIFDRFRAGVAPQIGVGDHATHYDLGITYMEMGVFTEAITEFRIALEGAGYRQRCLELLATCYSRLDRPDLAAAHWRAAIQEAGDGQGEVALRYELACALAAAGNVADAREELRRVLGRDPSFDAARVRLESLGS